MSTDRLDRVKAFFGEPEPAPTALGRFQIVRELARGGTAVVYEARDPQLGRSVALKVLREGDLERLRREASAAARLRHPNVVAIHEVGPDYIAMDLLLGRTLSEAWSTLSPDERLAALETVARAVAHAHEHGVIHRDLKPRNVMIEPDGRIVLTDFGLARIEGGEDLTKTGSVQGTPHFMAPEQVRGQATTPATDVWALGVMLAESLLGRKPFEGATALALYDAIVREETPALPGDLGAIAAKALEKDPARRYPDAGAFADDLGRARRGEPISVRPEGALGRTLRRVRRNPVPMIAAVVIAVIASLAVGRQIERDRARRALREQARVSLDAALALRRAGAIAPMRRFLPPLEEACREVPDSAEADYLLGRLHRALVDEARALDCQERALARDPAYAPAHYERAVLVALRDGRPELDEAARSPERWRTSVRDDAQRAPPGSVAEGLVAFADGRSADARRAFEEALAKDPLLEEARALLSLVIRGEIGPSYEEQERRFRLSEELYTQGLEKDRGYLPHYYGRGELRWSRGSRRRHRGFDPTPDYGAAEQDFSAALGLDPSSFRAQYWRGQVKVYQAIWQIETGGDPEPRLAAAEADLARAIELNPTHSSGWLWRGNARFYRGFWKLGRGLDPRADFEAAETDLSEAVRLAVEPSNERRWRGRLRAQLAAFRPDPAAVFDLAEADFAESEKKSPKDAWLWTWRSTVFSRRAAWDRTKGADPEPDFARAAQMLDRAIALDRALMETWKHRGFVRWERAQHLEASGQAAAAKEAYSGAAADFLEALSINPTLKHTIGERADVARRKAAE